jgi:hypothetical protein
VLFPLCPVPGAVKQALQTVWSNMTFLDAEHVSSAMAARLTSYMFLSYVPSVRFTS